MPELHHLRAFVAVAEELNFTRAAERLHMAQQAVSGSVRRLERELGVDLLSRTTRQVTTTPAGDALLASGRRVLAAADAAFAEAAEVGRGLSGTVTLGVSPAVGPADARRAVAALRAAGHDVGVSVREVRPGEVARLLTTREVDVVLARTLRDDAGIESAALTPTPAVLAVPASHPLAAGGPVPPAAIGRERLLVRSAPGTPYTDLLVARLAAAGARPEVVESRITGASDLSEVAGEGCVSLLAEGAPAAPGVAFVALAEPITLPLLVAWAAGTRPAAVARLRDAMAAER